MNEVRTCVAVMCRGDEGRFLAVRRRKPPLEGMWTLPGGGVEFGETLQDAARRELQEEANLIAIDLKQVGLHEYRSAEYHFITVLFASSEFTGSAIAGDDVDALEWLHLSQVNDRFSAGELIFMAAGATA